VSTPTIHHPTITSTGNRRIVEARKLDQRKHRQRQGRFLVEGLQILHMGLDAGARPTEVFFCSERFRLTGADLVPVSERVMRSLSERDTPQGLAAAFELFETELEAITPTHPDLIVVLDRLQDPGNIGTIIRTADAVGAGAVVLIEPCVDPFDPKTVRGSMGSLFNVPLVRTDQIPALFEWLATNELHAVGADAHQGEAWDSALWDGSVALVLGNEAQGLSEDVRPHIERWARLPIRGRAESLNVAVAGGVLMYSWLRENQQQ
jgi:TrmH family RNA methyltransferase